MAGFNDTKIRSVSFPTDTLQLRAWSVKSLLRSVASRVVANRSLRRLAETPLFVMAAGFFSAAAYVGNLIAGLAVTGVCLVVLELVISDSDVEPIREVEHIP